MNVPHTPIRPKHIFLLLCASLPILFFLTLPTTPTVSTPPKSPTPILHTTTNSTTNSTPNSTPDLAALLNIPSYQSQSSPNGSHLLPYIPLAATQNPSGILSRYFSLAHPAPSHTPICARMPHISLLRRAVHTHAAARINTTYDACIESDTCLFIQITSSLSAPPSATFIAAASKLAKRFKQVVILPVGDVAVASVDAARMKDALMQTSPHLEIRVRAEVLDDAVGLVSLARHVLVHREAISALCGLIATGRVYHTEDVRGYFKQNEYKWLVVDKEALYEENVKEPDALRRLAYMGDVHASCCIFERFGKGDGEKIVCKNASGFRREACWVVSIGCDGKWSFERSILRKTGCVVHTFDCTGTWRVPEDLKHRVTFHKLCVSDVAKGAYRTWRDLIEIGSRSVSRTGIRMPALAKMDIEGFEYAVLNGLVDGSVETMLPEQLVLEVHVDTGNDRVGVPWRHLGRKHNRVGAAVVRGLFGGLEMRGYRLVHRADNPFCAHCSEVTLVRSVGLPEWRWHV